MNCNSVDLERILGHIDVYMFGHIVGWILKSLLIRHYGLCWVISVTWELTEVLILSLIIVSYHNSQILFLHNSILLPNLMCTPFELVFVCVENEGEYHS